MNQNKLRTLSLIFVSGFVSSTFIFSFWYFSAQSDQEKSFVELQPDNAAFDASGTKVYLVNYASCHGKALEGQANWRKLDSERYMPTQPHNEEGHTWHSSENYLFLITTYGIERIIDQKYSVNMPAYDGQIIDKEIVTVIPYIKLRSLNELNVFIAKITNNPKTGRRLLS